MLQQFYFGIGKFYLVYFCQILFIKNILFAFGFFTHFQYFFHTVTLQRILNHSPYTRIHLSHIGSIALCQFENNGTYGDIKMHVISFVLRKLFTPHTNIIRGFQAFHQIHETGFRFFGLLSKLRCPVQGVKLFQC